MTDRVLRSNSTPVMEEIELIDTKNGLVGLVVELEALVGQNDHRIEEEVAVELGVGVVDKEGEPPNVPHPKLQPKTQDLQGFAWLEGQAV